MGTDTLEENPSVLAGSEYLEVIEGMVAGAPSIDIDNEIAVQEVCRQLISGKIIHSAHDVSVGGLAVALVESMLSGGLGFESKFSVVDRWDCVLFGEQQSRILVSLPKTEINELERVCNAKSVSHLTIGEVKGTDFKISNLFDVSLKNLKNRVDSSLNI